MRLSRDWVTPITIGAFMLTALTGVLMFFHLDSGLNKVAHEWLSWLLLAGVVMHALVNLTGFKRYFREARGRAIIALFTLVLALSFLRIGASDEEPPFMAPARALAQAPLDTLAVVARVTPDEMRARLVRAGLKPTAETRSLAELAGNDSRRQIQILGRVLRSQ